jgi:hypothetical protein
VVQETWNVSPAWTWSLEAVRVTGSHSGNEPVTIQSDHPLISLRPQEPCPKNVGRNDLKGEIFP